jgi:hypothetical protein
MSQEFASKDESLDTRPVIPRDGRAIRRLYRWFFVFEWWALFMLLQTGVVVWLSLSLKTISRFPERQLLMWGIALGSGILILLPSGVAATLFIALHYKCWELIQDGHARTEPVKAVGLMFAPVFNLYWGFVAIRGLALDMNAYVRRHALTAPKASVGLATAYCLGGVLGIVPGLRVVSMVPLFALQVLVIRSLKNTAAEIADAGTNAHPREAKAWPGLLLACACIISAGLAALAGFLLWPQHATEIVFPP